MTDETGSLVLEHLWAIRADISALKDDMCGVLSAQSAFRHDMHAQSIHIQQVKEDVALVKVRLDRIERRFDLVDAK